VLLWTARGEINARIVAAGLRVGLRPVGLCGADGGMILAEKRPVWTLEGEDVDFGHVGDVQSVDTDLLATLLKSSFIPVLAPVGTDRRGALFNINADTIACEVAVGVGADQLVLVADSGGLRADRHDPASIIRSLDRAGLERGVSEGWIQDGMRVKVTMALQALDRGVGAVRIAAPAGIADPTSGTRIILQSNTE
jgi:acetylglutamate kinase